MIRHVRQRTQSDCGVACVAMLAGVSYRRALAAFPPTKRGWGRSTHELVLALRALDVHPLSTRHVKLTARRQVITEQYVLLVREQVAPRRWHWMVWEPSPTTNLVGRLLDPAEGCEMITWLVPGVYYMRVRRV